MTIESGKGIQVPENLFKAIDRVHRKATTIYNNLDKDALELISPTRSIKKDTIKTTIIKPK